MLKSGSTRSALLALGAAALLAALVFLFVKTEAIDFKNDAQALSLLREMKDLDTRWDVDALRLANDLSAAPATIADRGPMLARILRELESGPVRSAIAEQLPRLRSGMTEKEAAFVALRGAHGRSFEAFRTAAEALRDLSAATAVARTRPSTSGDRVAALLALIGQVRSALQNADIEDLDEAINAAESRIAVLRPTAVGTDPFLGESAARAESAARSFLAARKLEAAAWRKFSLLTVGARVELAARNLSKAIEAALDDKDRWRVYLFAYAAALLIGVGYLGVRVATTQRELRLANEELEQRVSERTRDLSQTLKRLKESEAQLVQSEKMSSLGQMVAGVAHEINSPLAYVKNSVTTVRDRMPDLHDALAQTERLLAILQSESPDPAEVAQIFEILEARLGRLHRERILEDLDGLTRDGLHGIEQIVDLVKNLKNFSRLDRSKVASFNVNEGVQATLLIAKSSLRKIDIEKRLGDIPSITCSPSQVNQVLLNLVTNSAQAMDKPRGRIIVSTRIAGPAEIAIEVEDNGKGIPPEALPKIFDPFFTTKEVGKGTGLGLSIAYKIVTQHGGRIDVRSTVGVGTTVTVTLPVVPPPELAAMTQDEACVA